MRAAGADQQGSLGALEVFGHRPHGAPAGGLLWEGPVKYPAPRPLPPQKACPLRRWDCLPVRSRQRCPSDHRSLRSRLPGCAQRSGSTFRGSGWEFLSSPARGWDFKREHGPLSLCLGRILHCRCDTLQYVDFVCVPGSKQDDDADLCAILTLLLHPEASPQPPQAAQARPPPRSPVLPVRLLRFLSRRAADELSPESASPRPQAAADLESQPLAGSEPVFIVHHLFPSRLSPSASLLLLHLHSYANRP